jgi:hypothetical protein
MFAGKARIPDFSKEFFAAVAQQVPKFAQDLDPNLVCCFWAEAAFCYSLLLTDFRGDCLLPTAYF